MFFKSLIFVLLGITLVIASPINQDSSDNEVIYRFSWKDSISNAWNNVKGAVKGVYNQFNISYEDALQAIKKQIGEVVKIGKEQYQELMKEYEQLQQDANADIEKEKKHWQNELKKFENDKEKVEELKIKAEEAIEKQKQIWQTKFENWKNNVKEDLEQQQ